MRLLSRVHDVLGTAKQRDYEPAPFVGIMAIAMFLVGVGIGEIDSGRNAVLAQQREGGRSAEAEQGQRRSPEAEAGPRRSAEGDRGPKVSAEGQGAREGDKPLKQFKPQTQREAALYQMVLQLQQEMATLRRAVESRDRSSRDGDGPSPFGPREGDRPSNVGPREGDRPSNVGPRDGDGPSPFGPREGDRPSTTRPREGDRPSTTRPREGDRPSTTRPREGDRPSTTRPREGDRPSTTRPREGEGSGDRKNPMEVLFRRHDRNQDGNVSKQEFVMLRDGSQNRQVQAYWSDFFQRFDRNRNGSWDRNEFLAAAKSGDRGPRVDPRPREGDRPSTTRPREGDRPSTTRPREGDRPSTTRPREGDRPSATGPREGDRPSTTGPRKREE